MFDAKFFAADVVGNKMPTEIGQIVKIKKFFGGSKVPVKVTEISGSMFFAEVI